MTEELKTSSYAGGFSSCRVAKLYGGGVINEGSDDCSDDPGVMEKTGCGVSS